MAAELKVKKSTFKHVESELFAYHDTRKEIIRLRNEIMYGSENRENSGFGRSSLPSDPTGRVATKLASHKLLNYLESTVEAIENVYNRLPEEKKLLVNIYYWTRPQTLSWEGVAQKLHVSRKTAFNWRDEIIWAISEQLGWR
jgi:RinA family phage transcriptional activator